MKTGIPTRRPQGFDRSGMRRSLLLAGSLAPLLGLPSTGRAATESASPASAAQQQLAALEKESGGRLGVFAAGPALRQPLGYREHERFPACSTFKVLAAGAILRRSAHDAGLLQRRVHYRRADLVEPTSWPIPPSHNSTCARE
jgi:beta-lactamase class A